MRVYFIEHKLENNWDLKGSIPMGVRVYRFWEDCLDKACTHPTANFGLPEGFFYAYQADFPGGHIKRLRSTHGDPVELPLHFTTPIELTVIDASILDCDDIRLAWFEETIRLQRKVTSHGRPYGGIDPARKIDARTASLRETAKGVFQVPLDAETEKFKGGDPVG